MNLFASDLPDDLHVGDHEVPGSGRTPPPARTPRTGGHQVDLEDWGEHGPVGVRRRWLLLAAVVPWAVVVAIMVTDRGPATDVAAVAQATSTASDEPAVDEPEPTDAPRGVRPSATPDRPPTDVVAIASGGAPDARGAAEGLALVVARSWLSTRPAGTSIDGLSPAPSADREYVEHLAVESVDHPARGALVVTVRAIVLPIEGDRYGAARTRRVAVPVVLASGDPRLGGTPWPLPAPPVALDPPEQAPTDDPDLMLAAVDAITAVGYRDVELVELARTSGWAWVASLRARGPDEEEARDHRLWLRSDVGRLVVAGAAAPTPARPPAADVEPSPRESTPPATPDPTEAPS